MYKKNLKIKLSLSEKAFAAWLRHDPFVNLFVVQDDEDLRRHIMLDFLGPKAVRFYYGKLPSSKGLLGPILPRHIRDLEKEYIKTPESRTSLIAKLVFWATDKRINASYIKSDETRKQIITSLLGPMFVHANHTQEKLILAGIKKIAFTKKTATGKSGEQSPSVNQLILDAVTDLLIHNQKTIISKAVSETEERMRAELLRSIQNLKGKRFTPPFHDSTFIGPNLPPERFPLKKDTVAEMTRIIEGYLHSPWDIFRIRAENTLVQLEKLRHPLNVDTPEAAR